jgi:hypothetical protein
MCGHACLPIILAQELVHHAQIPGIFFLIFIKTFFLKKKQILTRVKKYLEKKKKNYSQGSRLFFKGLSFFIKNIYEIFFLRNKIFSFKFIWQIPYYQQGWFPLSVRNPSSMLISVCCILKMIYL